MASVSDRFGRSLTFHYDSAGRLDQMTTPNGFLFGYAHDPFGNLQSVAFPDGTTRVYKHEQSMVNGGSPCLIDPALKC